MPTFASKCLLNPHEVLFGDKALSLNSSDSQILQYVKSKYPIIYQSINQLEYRYGRFQGMVKPVPIEKILIKTGAHPAMMNLALFKTYEVSSRAKFQSQFFSHLKRRLIRAILLQEKTPEGQKLLAQGSIKNKYLNKILMSRYQDFFKTTNSFHRPLTDMEIRNVTENEKPLLDYVLLKQLGLKQIDHTMTREQTIKLAMFDYYYSLARQSLGRNAGDFFYFLTRKEFQALREYLFQNLNTNSQLLSIHLLSR